MTNLSQSTNNDLSTLSVATLKGVGPALEKKLEKLHIFSIQDLLFHLPYRYQDRTHISPIASLRGNDHAVIEGDIIKQEVKRSKRISLLLTLSDGSATLTLRFFHFLPAQKLQLVPGVRLRCFGEVRLTGLGKEMMHPEYQRITQDEILAVDEHLTPLYPSVNGISQKQWRNLSEQALSLVKNNAHFHDYLQENQDINTRYPSIQEAIINIHRPPPDADTALLMQGLHPWQQRLAFEELLAHRLCMRNLRGQMQCLPAPNLENKRKLEKNFLQQLPFDLTDAQARVSKEIYQDLCQSTPMLRLVQGDVGCGKTVVAALAILHASACGYQAAFMAPTDLLAEQHVANFKTWLEPLGLNIAWLAGKHKGNTRKQVLQAIEQHEANVVIGTHALFQEHVNFAKLGLVVIDEQHRFGVMQRLALREKAGNDITPHQLVMTATPIPRTLAMTQYADLDVSIIDALPPGRKPIQTIALANSKRQQLIQRVRDACAEGRQAYWVCTLIEDSESIACQAAQSTFESLQQLLPSVKIALVHGKMKAQEKEAVMQAFKAGDYQLLVATTVIEVGVDVPNASLMIIDNAERLGLSQLHQLRGRVGRGSAESFCVLLYHTPLSQHAKARIQVMRDTQDGFIIANKDLKLRGPGEWLGTKQTGLLNMKVADIKRDESLFDSVAAVADTLITKNHDVIEKIIARWLPMRDQFARV